MSENYIVNYLRIGLPALLVGIIGTWVYHGGSLLDFFGTPNYVEIDVEFNGKCPVNNPSKFTKVSPSQKVRFTSNPKRLNGTEDGPFNEFNLSIGPFTSSRYDSDKGVLKIWKKVTKEATPKGGSKGRHTDGQDEFPFKYTINALDCPAVDPLIIIEH